MDFVCQDKKLIIEVDGGQHGEKQGIENDEKRTVWLESAGYHVLRFWDNEVLQNINGVLTKIEEAL